MSAHSGVHVSDEAGVRTIEFASEKANALNLMLLRELKAAFESASTTESVRVVVLRSAGDRSFCAGASFDEMRAAQSAESAHEFFMGFGEVILAMRSCTKFVLCRVQGKAVGGGVGLVSASDYACAHESASVRLSEITIGLGPFVIAAPVTRRIGVGAFSELSIDGDWRDAKWGLAHSLFAKVLPTHEALDREIQELASRFKEYSPDAVRLWKAQLWSDTSEWGTLLKSRAGVVGGLALKKTWEPN